MVPAAKRGGTVRSVKQRAEDAMPSVPGTHVAISCLRSKPRAIDFRRSRCLCQEVHTSRKLHGARSTGPGMLHRRIVRLRRRCGVTGVERGTSALGAVYGSETVPISAAWQGLRGPRRKRVPCMHAACAGLQGEQSWPCGRPARARRCQQLGSLERIERE